MVFPSDNALLTQVGPGTPGGELLRRYRMLISPLAYVLARKSKKRVPGEDLVLAAVVGHMTLGIQILKAAMMQLGAEMEEAARTTGATWWYSFRKVMLPILTPTLILVGIVNFIGAARDISTVALLATNATRTLALLQLDHMVDGRWEAAAVISAVVVGLTVGAALLARLLGLRLGIRA